MKSSPLNQSSLSKSLPDKSRYPIFNATEWPKKLVDMFTNCNNEEFSLEERLYAPINSLLYWAFGPGIFAYVVSPERPPNNTTQEFIVYETKSVLPVLVVEISSSPGVGMASLRLEADANIRKRFKDIEPTCPLFGLSLLGTATRIYCGDIQTRDVTPILVQPPADTELPIDFLADGWVMDILSTEGFCAMKEIIEDILKYSANEK